MLHYNISIFIDNRGEEGLAYVYNAANEYHDLLVYLLLVVAKELTVEAYTHQITLACT